MIVYFLQKNQKSMDAGNAANAKGAEKPGPITNNVWKTICGRERGHADEALEIGRTSDNPRFKFLARLLKTIIATNPGMKIEGMYDEKRATKTELKMDAKRASGVNHSKEDAWIKNFWVRIGRYKPSVNALNDPQVFELFTLMSAVVGAYSDESLCYDSQKVFEAYNAKVSELVSVTRTTKKIEKKKKAPVAIS